MLYDNILTPRFLMTGDRKNIEIGMIFFDMLGQGVIQKGNEFNHYFKVLRENITGEEFESFCNYDRFYHREVGEKIAESFITPDLLSRRFAENNLERRRYSDEENYGILNCTCIYLINFFQINQMINADRLIEILRAYR